jgi:hypothetical protein
VNHFTPTQPLSSISPSTHGPSNIIPSLIPHMHTPNALLGRHISHMANSQVVQTTMVTRDIQPPSPTLPMGTPFIGGQISMGGQPSSWGKPSSGGKIFTGWKPSITGKTPMWLQHQKTWGQATPMSHSIPTTIDLYLGQPYPRFSNSLWG